MLKVGEGVFDFWGCWVEFIVQFDVQTRDVVVIIIDTISKVVLSSYVFLEAIKSKTGRLNLMGGDANIESESEKGKGSSRGRKCGQVIMTRHIPRSLQKEVARKILCSLNVIVPKRFRWICQESILLFQSLSEFADIFVSLLQQALAAPAVPS